MWTSDNTNPYQISPQTEMKMSISGVDIIVNMPSGVVVEILTTWLCLPDVSRLDKSFCCHASRAHFLQVLNCSEMVFHDTRDKFNTKSTEFDIENYLKWVVSRRIHVSQLKLPNFGNTIKRIQGNLFELTGKSLRDISLSNSNDNIAALLDVIAINCPQLVRFVAANMQTSRRTPSGPMFWPETCIFH